LKKFILPGELLKIPAGFSEVISEPQFFEIPPQKKELIRNPYFPENAA
jgi:hypothetical protein